MPGSRGFIFSDGVAVDEDDETTCQYIDDMYFKDLGLATDIRTLVVVSGWRNSLGDTTNQPTMKLTFQD